MGDPKFPKKKYQKPGHPWQAARIKQEGELTKKYGLSNKKEIWKHASLLRNWRGQARSIAALREQQRKAAEVILVTKLQKLGILKEKAGLDDVLSLSVLDLLDKRLQTVVFKMGLASTVGQARQFTTHNKVMVNGKVINAPSHLIKVGDAVSFIPKFKPKIARKETLVMDTIEKPVEVIATKDGPVIREVKSDE